MLLKTKLSSRLTLTLLLQGTISNTHIHTSSTDCFSFASHFSFAPLMTQNIVNHRRLIYQFMRQLSYIIINGKTDDLLQIPLESKNQLEIRILKQRTLQNKTNKNKIINLMRKREREKKGAQPSSTSIKNKRCFCRCALFHLKCSNFIHDTLCERARKTNENYKKQKRSNNNSEYQQELLEKRHLTFLGSNSIANFISLIFFIHWLGVLSNNSISVEWNRRIFGHVWANECKKHWNTAHKHNYGTRMSFSVCEFDVRDDKNGECLKKSERERGIYENAAIVQCTDICKSF